MNTYWSEILLTKFRILARERTISVGAAKLKLHSNIR